MRSNSHSAQIERSAIGRILDLLIGLFNHGKVMVEKIAKLKEHITNIDNHNPDFADILEDHREKNKMFLILFVAGLSIILDFILIVNPLSIIRKSFHLPEFLIYLIPLILVIIEIGVSYTSILRRRSGEHDSWIGRNLQYVIIALLIALSVLLLVYLAKGYDSSIDGSFTSFLLGNMIIQIILLIPSIMLHLWIVHHSEQIADAFSFVKYLFQKRKNQRKVQQLEKEYKEHVVPKFTKEVRNFIEKKENYEAAYGDGRFDRIVPKDLGIAINKVMGREIFYYDAKVYEEINDTNKN